MTFQESHRLCNKLERWINHNCNHHHNNVQPDNTNLSHPKIIPTFSSYSSPYKKTTFETLLRKYPTNRQETKKNLKTTQQREKEQIYNLKRTFESRILKFDNIKSKIDTNLNRIKTLATKKDSQQPNGQNIYSQENIITRQQAHDYTIENNRGKKIKLSSGFYQNYKTKNSNSFISQNDQNNKGLINKGMQTIKNDKNTQIPKQMFKINLSKKINIFETKNKNQNTLENVLNQNDENINKTNQIQLNRMRELNILEGQQQKQGWVSLGEGSKIMLRSLIEQNTESFNHNDQDILNIFSFEGYQRMESQNKSNTPQKNIPSKQNTLTKQLIQNTIKDQPIENTFNYQIVQNINLQNYYERKYFLDNIDEKITKQMKQIQQIQDNYLEQSEQKKQSIENIEQKNIVLNLNQQEIVDLKDEGIKVSGQQARETFFVLNNQFQNTLSSQNNYIISQDTQTNPLKVNGLFSNLPHLTSLPIQKQNKTQKISHKPTFERLKREHKSKDYTRILTRSTQDKLSLFNKLSMRIIRKKYGQNLSHYELADKILVEQKKINLKAIIQNHQRKSVFEFKQLSEQQMKNILIKYFLEQQKQENNKNQ